LLIPEYLFFYFRESKETHGDMTGLLRFLLRKYYRNNRFYFAKDIAATVSYQEQNLRLHREDFRMIEEQWLELKLLAGSCNMSICRFFIFLLRLEMAGGLEGDLMGGVPPTPKKISLFQSLTCGNIDPIPEFLRLLHMRV